jgi:glycosyltransferase involved in cell wall biosynthesis
MESVVAALAAGHAGRGHDVRVAAVISPSAKSHPYMDSLQAQGVHALAIRVGDRGYRAERRSVRALCVQNRPDVVHTHGFRPDVIDGGIARAQNIPVISTCHGFIEFGWRGAIYQWLQRRALRAYDAIVAVSADIASQLRDSGVPPERTHIVLNAFRGTGSNVSRNAARQLLDLPDTPIIGWVGRLSAEKGPDIAIEAFARLKDSASHLVMIGDGREEPSLRSRAAELGVAHRILWRGSVPNVGRLFSAFDVFLLSSRTEGTPMVLLEAMSARVPIVATPVGGVVDVVDVSSAWLTPGLDEEGIAGTLDQALTDQHTVAERVDRASKRLAQRFAVEPWLSRHESIYREAISRSRR